ncbi:type II toxin-antitoxin system RelE/ParE family toxin [Polaribacter aestuariivivens]|uniref:Type II toxin-antitoxin system RelE/ParE family toxin n=1 Tax=Polaribacter aestuariivivens TaxID=2304626 RepID=A0A5S3NBD9_9FLAO|nr:type II toxin-antitoxin system RelE/ParE family toxin [Polaribacter aestuariivivens]TMM32452.1 type II toxin-antitoxin system RelE/ParE family toxin [Polaribacter aestuariivivens]
MGNYKLSGASSNDVVGIYKFGIVTFGLYSAKEYVASLELFLEELSERPELARDASMFAKDLLFYRYKAHVIFYVFDGNNEILVIRILGKRMDFIQHL